MNYVIFYHSSVTEPQNLQYNRMTSCFVWFWRHKGRFHEATKSNEIGHRCIQIDRWVKQTCRHRPIDIGTALADDQTSYFIIGRQDKLSFGAKITVQCSDQLKHKIALKFSKK